MPTESLRFESDAFQHGLAELTHHAEKEDIAMVARLTGLPVAVVRLSLDCVGERRRKPILSVKDEDEMESITHFTHMARVAFMMLKFFPEDQLGRHVGMLHDAKEEARKGSEEAYLRADTLADFRLTPLIEVMTERYVKGHFDQQEGDPDSMRVDWQYIHTYRQHIAELTTHWSQIGPVKLCDRLDGADFSYLLNTGLEGDELKTKALMSIGRVWATISGSDHHLADSTRARCLEWSKNYRITEEELLTFSNLFLSHG